MDNIVLVSGGFDPLHIGHLRMFKASKERGAIVIVGSNSDAWLTRKKGQPFMVQAERIEILKAIKYIDYVYTFNDSDDSACNLIEKVIDKVKTKDHYNQIV